MVPDEVRLIVSLRALLDSTMTNPDEDAIMAQADKDLEERANRAKEILSMRYKSLRQDQVSGHECHV